MQAAQSNVDASGTVLVGNCIGPPCRRDIDLDDDQVGFVVQRHPPDVLIPDRYFVVLVEKTSQGREPKRWEERVLDGAEERAGGLGQGGENHLYSHEQLTS